MNTIIDNIRKAIRRRKRHREVKRKLRQGHKAKREARAIRKLRRRLASYLAPRTQWDAVTVGNVPTDAQAVGAYANGDFANVAEMHNHVPDARMTTIAVSSDVQADCLDIEAGDATNADAPGWYLRFKARHPLRKPIFYTSASNVAALVETLGAAGVPREKYLIWSAHWIGRHVCSPMSCGFPKADCTQFSTHNETVDESKCRPSYWRRSL